MLTSCCVEAPPTAVALEVFGFLMGDEKLKIFKIAFAYGKLLACAQCYKMTGELHRTVIAPRSGEDFFHVGMATLFLAHDGGGGSFISS